MSDSNSSSGGIGLFGLLTVAFIVLKLTDVIDWSWWWVTSPFWGPIALFIVGFVIYILFETYKQNEKRKEHSKYWEGEKLKRKGKFARKMNEMLEEAEKNKKNGTKNN